MSHWSSWRALCGIWEGSRPRCFDKETVVKTSCCYREKIFESAESNDLEARVEGG